MFDLLIKSILVNYNINFIYSENKRQFDMNRSNYDSLHIIIN